MTTPPNPTAPRRVLVGVGTGPGDPDLLTVKAVKLLGSADVVVVPVMDGETKGRAEACVEGHVPADRLRRAVFALDDRGGLTDRRVGAWEAAADLVAAAFAGGATTVAFATIGDPNVYSTFSYLAQSVHDRVEGLVVETIPGITALQDLASRAGISLVEGEETLALIPLTAGTERLRAALAESDCVVAYKGGRHLPEMAHVLAEAGRLDGAVIGSSLGLPEESVRAVRAEESPSPYLSTVIVPPVREQKGGRL